MKMKNENAIREQYRAQFARERSATELDGYGMPDRTLELRYHPPAQHGGVIVDSDHVYTRVCPERLISLPDGQFQTAVYELPEYWSVFWSYPSGFAAPDSVHQTLESAIARFDALRASAQELAATDAAMPLESLERESEIRAGQAATLKVSERTERQ